MGYSFELSATIPASPQAVYDAWMSTKGHSAMTGGAARVDPAIGGQFTAWDGYITGYTVALDPGKRIVQTWRTSEFDEDAADSQIDVALTPAGNGTLITLSHSGVPDDQTGYETNGWNDFYFEPMVAYFGASAS